VPITALRSGQSAEASPPTPAWRWLDGAALFTLLVALFALLGRGTFFTSDEGGIFNTALSLIRHRSLAVAPGENIHRGKDGSFYASREILPTLLCLPPCAAGLVLDYLVRPDQPPVAPFGGQLNGTNWPVFVTVTLLGPMAVAATLLLLRRFVLADGGSRGEALWLTVAAGGATPFVVYAKTIFPQVFEAACLMLAFGSALRWRQAGAPGTGLVLGVACGLGLMCRAAFAPLCGWFLGSLLLAGPATRPARVRAVLLFLVPVALGAAVTGWVNWLRWGSPLDFGYHHAYETFDTPAWVGLYGLLASPGKGLLVYAPSLLVPLLFARTLWQRGRAEVVLALGLTATYLAVYCRWYDWQGGLAWGPRFLLPLIPPWLALTSRALAGPGAAPARGLLLGTGLVGAVVQLPGLLLHPQWMNVYKPDAFSLTESHVVELAGVLLEFGADDLWLWSPAGAGSGCFWTVLLSATSLGLGATLVLCLRATAWKERSPALLLCGLLGLLVAGAFL
jgi:hypothetical protein